MARTKEQQATYMRDYRARLVAAKAMQRSVDDLGAEKPDVHAACDEKIALLEAEVQRLRSTYATPRTTPIEAEGGLVRTPVKAKDWGRIIAPAPNDECANCGHDKQSFHLGGKCEFPLGTRRCPCPAFVEDLGFG